MPEAQAGAQCRAISQSLEKGPRGYDSGAAAKQKGAIGLFKENLNWNPHPSGWLAWKGRPREGRREKKTLRTRERGRGEGREHCTHPRFLSVLAPLLTCAAQIQTTHGVTPGVSHQPASSPRGLTGPCTHGLLDLPLPLPPSMLAFPDQV